MTLEPLFSMSSSMCPAGNSFFETSHVSSVAVTLMAPSPLPELPFSVQPGDGCQGRRGGGGGDDGESDGSHAGS